MPPKQYSQKKDRTKSRGKKKKKTRVAESLGKVEK